MLDGGTNCGKGEQLRQPYMVRGTIGGAVFGPTGQLAARTTYGVTVLPLPNATPINVVISLDFVTCCYDAT